MEKMKTKIVFKVVNNLGSIDKPKLVSGLLSNPFSTTYEVGKATFPQKGTKLFAFRTLKEARAYRTDNVASRKIFRAKAENVSKIGWLESCIYELSSLQRAFQYYHPNPKKGAGPITGYGYFKSTVGCDSITLLEEVK